MATPFSYKIFLGHLNDLGLVQLRGYVSNKFHRGILVGISITHLLPVIKVHTLIHLLENDMQDVYQELLHSLLVWRRCCGNCACRKLTELPELGGGPCSGAGWEKLLPCSEFIVMWRSHAVHSSSASDSPGSGSARAEKGDSNLSCEDFREASPPAILKRWRLSREGKGFTHTHPNCLARL